MGYLKKRFFPDINETFYFNRLDNGLMVYLLPKKGFQESLAMMTVGFGSLDNQFTINYETKKNYPTGLAHFLEHQLFERAGQKDLADQLTRVGADSNAFTSFDQTSFYVSTAMPIKASLNVLQEALTSTHFTDLSIQKEKEIITQEIAMYQDDPSYCLYHHTLQNLYPMTAMEADVAGSKESIKQISLSDLEDNFTYFYHPSNCTLLVVGDFDVKSLYKEIVTCQRRFPIERDARLERQKLALNPVIAKGSVQMQVSLPKLAIGLRVRKSYFASRLKEKMAMQVLFSLVFGWTSKYYQAWYNDQKIDDSFVIEVEVINPCEFIMISLDTKEPIAMANSLKTAIKQIAVNQDLNEAHLTLVKKELYGNFMKGFDCLADLAGDFMSSLSDDETLFDYLTVLSSLTLADIKGLAAQLQELTDLVEFTIFPK